MHAVAPRGRQQLHGLALVEAEHGVGQIRPAQERLRSGAEVGPGRGGVRRRLVDHRRAAALGAPGAIGLDAVVGERLEGPQREHRGMRGARSVQVRQHGACRRGPVVLHDQVRRCPVRVATDEDHRDAARAEHRKGRIAVGGIDHDHPVQRQPVPRVGTGGRWRDDEREPTVDRRARRAVHEADVVVDIRERDRRGARDRDERGQEPGPAAREARGRWMRHVPQLSRDAADAVARGLREPALARQRMGDRRDRHAGREGHVLDPHPTLLAHPIPSPTVVRPFGRDKRSATPISTSEPTSTIVATALITGVTPKRILR